jgi:hypothetical protein
MAFMVDRPDGDRPARRIAASRQRSRHDERHSETFRPSAESLCCDLNLVCHVGAKSVAQWVSGMDAIARVRIFRSWRH